MEILKRQVEDGTAGENVEILPTSKDDQSDKERELKRQPLDGDILASCDHRLDSKTATSHGSPNPIVADESPFQGTDQMEILKRRVEELEIQLCEANIKLEVEVNSRKN